MADDAQIDELRSMSMEIDRLYGCGKRVDGAALLESALTKAQGVDKAYHLFFLGEREGYLSADFSAQEALFRQALDLRPADYFLLRNLGVSLSKLGKAAEAIALYDQALALKPDDHHALRNKGVSLSQLGKEAEAIALYDQALALKPDDHHALRNKGVALSKLGKAAEAIALYDQALKLKPDDHHALREKGVAFGKLGKAAEAWEWNEKALALEPDDHHALRNKGVAFGKLGKAAEAWEWNEKALALEPDDVPAQVNKAYILHLLGRGQEALAWINDVVRRHPDDEYASRIQRHLHFLVAKGETPPASGGDTALERLSLQKVVGIIRKDFKQDSKDIKKKIKAAEREINTFLGQGSKLWPHSALFLILRKWNSYTPSIPRDDERSIGGGYFFLVNGEGTVVDPGFNFLENFHRVGGRIADIRNIVITHAHNDHTADLESILSLVYKYNADNGFGSPEAKGFKTVRLFMNVGSDRKFSGFIDLRGAEYIELVTVLTPEHEYDLGQNLWLRVLPAYHDEVIGKKYAVGLQFELRDWNDDPTRVVITSDTGLFPQKDKLADTKAKEIWELYKLEVDPIHLLVPHLGSVKESEFDADINSRPETVYYPNHLGLIGVIRVITALKPQLAVVSEFGEELRMFQEQLVKMIGACVQRFPVVEGKNKPVVLPGDITFMYDLRERGVYCANSGVVMPPTEKIVACKDGDCFYYLDDSKGTTDLNTSTKKYLEQLKKRKLPGLHKGPKKA